MPVIPSSAGIRGTPARTEDGKALGLIRNALLHTAKSEPYHEATAMLRESRRRNDGIQIAYEPNMPNHFHEYGGSLLFRVRRMLQRLLINTGQ